ncbi:MAG: hypothetical protein ACFBSD_12075 [Paracoccaceae bacterium]
MTELDAALERLETAVGALDIAVAKVLERSASESAAHDGASEGTVPGEPAAGEGGDPVVAAERDRLAAEVAQLRAQSVKDAELRAEAAEAVKAALRDLRALMPEEERHG